MKKILLWLDDYRDPFDKKIDWMIFSPIGKDINIKWVKTQQEFQDYIMINELPDAICFDHDLGTGNGDGYECAKWLCKYCDKFEKELPLYAVQSSNVVGKQNIISYLENYKRIKNEEKLLKWYRKGFHDELWNIKSNPPIKMLKAYELGKNHAILGDDCRNFDSLTDKEILERILI